MLIFNILSCYNYNIIKREGLSMNIKDIWIFAIICLSISIYSFLRKEPMNFWAGQKMSKRKITNCKKYNLLNSLMWFIVGIYFSVGAYFEYVGNIHNVNIMINIFIKYIVICMVIYYLGIYYLFSRKKD